MSPLLWWTIPAVATTAAIAWASWTGRTRRPEDAYDGVRAYQRFRSAMESGAAPAGRDGGRRRRSRRTGS